MVDPEADWKNQSRNSVDWLFIATVSALLIFHLLRSLGGRTTSIALALVYVLTAVFYFTRYWQPILYAILAGVVTISTLGLVFVGDTDGPEARAVVILQVVLVGLCVYLFFYEEPDVPPETEP